MIEWELDAEFRRTKRYRLRQFYALVGDRRPPSQRVACEWRQGEPRVAAVRMAVRSWNSYT